MNPLLQPGYNFNPNTTAILPAGTTSDDILAAIQEQYGTQRYNQQKSSRWPYYSYANYPLAGTNALQFFGQNMAQAPNGTLDTNIEEPGNLGNYSYFIQAIYFDLRILNPVTPQPNVYTTDATAIYSDVVHGLTQAGYWELKIGTNTWDMCPFPLKYSPPGDGQIRMETSNAFAFSQAGMSPFAVTAAQNFGCYADLERRAWRRRILKNPLFLAPQQNFTASIRFDSGAVPIIATTPINSGTVAAVGCWFDGTRYAPIG